MFIPDYYQEVAEGVWQRRQPVNSFDVYNKDHDMENFIRILYADKRHYENLYKEVLNQMPELLESYNKVVSIGGGSPKFEIKILNAISIDIFDICPDFYMKAMPHFREIYEIPNFITINYLKQFITKPFSVDGAECVAFIHFLEHQNTFDQVIKWINLQKSDIIIYGPNIEAAQNEHWYHFGDNTIDHNVFFTMDAIIKIGEAAGYRCGGFAYSDDMLVWMKR